MKPENETPQEELTRLETELKELRKTMPEHCYGTKGYVCTHRATPKHWELIESTEERIKELKDAAD